MSAFTVEWEDESNTIDFDELELPQAISIQKVTGLNLLQLQTGCMTGDPQAIRAAYWVMLIQNGKDRAKLENVTKLKVVKFANALIKGLEKSAEERAEAEAEDPKE